MPATVGGGTPLQIEDLARSPDAANVFRLDTSGGAASQVLPRANYYITQLNVPHWYTTDGTAPAAGVNTMLLPAGRHSFGPPAGAAATWTLRVLPEGAGSAINRIAAIAGV